MLSPLYESNSLMVYDCRKDRSIPTREVKVENGFHKNDWNWVSSQAAMKRSADVLAKMAPKFRIFVLMNTGGHRQGIQAYEELRKNGLYQESPTQFNAVLGNNVSMPERHIPLTPWMCLHRAMHCVHGDENARKGKKEPLQPLLDFCKKHFIKGPDTHLDIFGDGSDVYDALMRTIMTTRCARTDNMSSVADVSSELLAQHFFGGVKFLRTKDWDARSKLLNPKGGHDDPKEWKYQSRNWRFYPSLFEMHTRSEETDNELTKLENELNVSIPAFVDSFVGQTARF